MLQIKLLGIGRVLDGETDVKLRSRNWTLPLLAYVLLHRSETIPRWRLAFTLWPDEPEESALQNLRRNLHLLVRALPQSVEPWLLIDAESIALNGAAEFRLDVAEYERLRADAATLERAVTLYDGDLLEELYDDWITAERERLRRLYHADLAALVARHRSLRNFAAAIHYAQRLLVRDPWREDILRQLMGVRYECGDAAGALAEFDRFARQLKTEMNVTPMQETVALREAIVRGAPIPGTANARREAVERVVTPTPFVGREKELAELRGYWSRAARGNGSFVVVRGEAGIGKSRLVSELALVVEAEGGRVIQGGTSFPQRSPYECVVESLRQALVMIAALPLPPQILTVVAELVPDLRTRLPDLPAPAHLDDRSERERLFAAVGRVMGQLARPRPVLVIYEDLHWADAATIALVSSIARDVTQAAILMVATSRDDEVAGAGVLRTLDRGAVPAPARVVVGPLAPSEVTALAMTLAPRENVEPNLARSIFERSEGNPLFATEMLRDVATGTYDSAAVPASVSELVAVRFATLQSDTQTLAQLAAVGGAAFAFDTVKEATGFSGAVTLDALNELLDRHLVRESAGRDRYEYVFTHHLIRGAIYDAIPSAVRARQHLRFAHVLETTYANEASASGEVALHYELGGDGPAAASWYLRAARHAASVYANVEAQELATRGLRLAPQQDYRLRFDLLLIRQEMNVRLGDRDPQPADLAELARLSGDLDDEAALTTLRLDAEFAHVYGALEQEATAVARLRQRADSSGEACWMAVAMQLQAEAAVRTSDTEAVLSDATAAQRLYATVGDTAGQVRALTYVSGAYTGLGRHDDAVRSVQEALEIAATDPMLRLIALSAAIAQTYESQQFARSAEFSREQLRISSELGHRGIESAAHVNLGGALRPLWHVDEALEHNRTGLALQKSMGYAYGTASLLSHAELLGDLGAFGEASAIFDEADAMARRIGRTIGELVCAIERAKVLWQQRAFEPMRQTVERASRLGEQFDRMPWWWFDHVLNRGRLLRHDGRYDEAAKLLNSVLPEMNALRRPMDEIAVTDELAAAYFDAGRTQEAVAAVEASRTLAARLEDPTVMWYPIEHHWIAAQVYRAAGDVTRSAASLDAAERIYRTRRDAIGDASLRATFEHIPLHCDLRAAVHYGTSEKTVPFPNAPPDCVVP